MKSSRSFPPDVASIRAARQFVLNALGGLTSERRDAIAVMVSELAMNAVQYARTPFVVRTQVDGDTVRVEVTDTASALPHAQPLPPPTSQHGRGLFLVSELADQWGVSRKPDSAGKTVWFQATLTSARQG